MREEEQLFKDNESILKETNGKLEEKNKQIEKLELNNEIILERLRYLLLSVLSIWHLRQT